MEKDNKVRHLQLEAIGSNFCTTSLNRISRDLDPQHLPADFIILHHHHHHHHHRRRRRRRRH